jgi:hypothetical protein
MGINAFFVMVGMLEGMAFIGSIWHYEDKIKTYKYFAKIDGRIMDEYYQESVDKSVQIINLKKQVVEQRGIISTMDADMNELHKTIKRLSRKILNIRETSP